MKKAIVLFSGGQDSTTCLAWAIAREFDVTCLVFDYGQKHSIEIEQAKKVAKMFNVECEVVNLKGIFENSALLNGGDTNEEHKTFKGLPASFVPGRNMVFMSVAGSIAKARGCDTIISGVCQTDYSGYPDCRVEFVQSMGRTIKLATEPEKPFYILTPLMHISKAQTWKMAKELNILDIVIEHSHTDYNGERGEKHEWGYGKLDNPATKLRADGYKEAKERGWV